MSVTRDDILAAIKSATGDPDTGLIHDATPTIVDAIDELVNPKPKMERAVTAPKETR